MKFLEHVANYLIDNKGHAISDIVLVFPNRRAGLFFQKYLSKKTDTPIFSPEIKTISNLVSDISKLQSVDQGSLVLLLYEVYTEVTKSMETLDDFYFWGEMLLADFNDIDKYLVDTKQLFSNITSLKEIDYGFDFLEKDQIEFLSKFWVNILNARDSKDKESFTTLWKRLDTIYNKFRERLLDKGWAYDGLMYRFMTEKLEESPDKISDKQHVMIGFNALNKCENLLFDRLKSNASALFFWDYDNFYLNNKHHEAGLFLHSNLARYPMPEDFELHVDNFHALKEIDVVAIPGFSGQASYASNWLHENKEMISNRFDNTAMVLCDESLLLPLLDVLPEEVDEFNITMGFPLKHSAVFGLIKSLQDINKHARDNKDGETIFYYRNVLSLLNSPLVKSRIGSFYEEFTQRLKSENRIYIKSTDFQIPLLVKIFSIPERADQISHYIQEILKEVFSATSEDDTISREVIYRLYHGINRLHESLFSSSLKYAEGISKPLFYQLLFKQLDKQTIPFEGEPLSGIQLMGFLETRNLDFDHLILLSFNDQLLPGNAGQHSFIPYNLRKGFDLPAVEHRNAMYAYYFYRLIQRAKKLTLVYDSRTEGMSNGEISRFATQLKYEATHLKINFKQGVFAFDPSENEKITIEKNAGVNAKLQEYFQTRMISPSALNTYLDCRLKFYFSYVEKIRETEEIREDIDHLLFGRIAHVALEELYRSYLGKVIDNQVLEGLLKDKKGMERALRFALQQEYFKQSEFTLDGRNLLVYEIIRKYIIRILKYDKSIAPFTLLGLEKQYSNQVRLTIDGKEINSTFGGTVDRLDRVGDQIRVVDYKTGASVSKVKSIASLFDANSSTRNKAAFQTMLYANCVQHERQEELPLVPAVYGARKVFMSDFAPEFTMNDGKLIYQSHHAEYEEHLKLLFAEILDPNEVFDQTKFVKTCEYCPFNVICNR